MFFISSTSITFYIMYMNMFSNRNIFSCSPNTLTVLYNMLPFFNIFDSKLVTKFNIFFHNYLDYFISQKHFSNISFF